MAAAVLILAVASASLAQQFFTDQGTFLANVKPGYYQENSEGWSEGNPLDGHQPLWDAPGANGFALTVSAPGSGNQELYSLYSAISTSSHNDPLTFQFSSNAVYAFGGEFWGTQFDGFPLLTQITFETDTGQSFAHEVSGRSFIGFISNVPLASVTISVAGFNPAWSTADSIITGDLNPEGDLDGDGMPNSSEQVAGTDPFNPNSNLRISSATHDSSGFVVDFNADAGKTYRLEHTNTLTDATWIPAPIADKTAASTGPQQFIDPIMPELQTRFYRVRVVQPDL